MFCKWPTADFCGDFENFSSWVNTGLVDRQGRWLADIGKVNMVSASTGCLKAKIPGRLSGFSEYLRLLGCNSEASVDGKRNSSVVGRTRTRQVR